MWDSIKLFFSTRKRYLIAFFSTLFSQIVAGGGAALVEASRNAVKAAETTGKTGSEKFDIAKQLVVDTLAAKGIPIIITAVNAAIEAAVAEMKK